MLATLAVPEAPPRQLLCEATSPESLQVSWQPPPETLVHGIIQGYRLNYEAIDDMRGTPPLHLLSTLENA